MIKRALLALLICCQILSSLAGRRIATTDLERLNARMKRDIEAVTLNKEYLAQTVELTKEENYVPIEHQVRNLVERDTQPIVYTNSLSFQDLQCQTETTCWAIGLNNKLYKSSDAMMTWAIQQTPASVRLYGIILTGNPNYIYLIGNRTACLITEDGGNTWTAIVQSIWPAHIRHHPTLPQYILAAQYQDLYVSTDFARTWKKIIGGITDVTWCNPGSDGIFSTDICLISNSNANGANGGGQSLFMITNTDAQVFTVTLQQKADYLIEHPNYLFVIADSQVGERKNLWISTDNGSTFDEALIDSGFTINHFLETQLLDDRGQIFIASTWNDNTNGAQVGSIYQGDGTGFRFSEILDWAIAYNNWWDFDVIRSLEGTYISSQSVTKESEGPGQHDFQMQTLITYNSGQSWSNLVPPTTTWNDTPVICNETLGPCHLNFFGKTTWLGIGGSGYYGDFWSAETAVGLILASGNIGQHLMVEADEVNTYFSSDAGVSWTEIAGHSSVYEFGDHGGVLIMVANQVLVKNLSYSLDFGQTWTTFQFTQTPVVVINLFTASSKRSAFVIFAARAGYSVYFGLDFSDIGSGVPCTSSDYSTWELKDEAGQQCLLGHDTVYLRRNPSSNCDIPDDFNPISSQTNCDCTMADYECNAGYEQSTYNPNLCLPWPGIVPEPLSVCYPNGSQQFSTGIRRVPGDTCNNDLPNITSVWAKCASGSTSSGVSTGVTVVTNGSGGVSGAVIAVILVVVLLVVGAAIFAGIMIGRKSAFCQEKFPFLKAPERFEVGYSNQLQTVDDDDEN